MNTAAAALFRLRLLGAPELQDELGNTPKALGRGKPLALLCYLAVRGEVRRDEIVDLLWRGIDEAKARNAFRQALHRLRLGLGEEIVPHDRDRLRLGASTRLLVDLTQFEAAVAAGRLAEAVDLYTGDFLDGFDLREPAFDLWAEQERTRLRGRFRQILHDAALQASNAGRWDEAIARTNRLLTLTPFDPDAAHLAATTLVSAGRRIEALELLRQFAARVERELGVEMRGDLRTLVTRLARESTTREPRVPTPAGGVPSIATLPLIGRQRELAQLLTIWRSIGEDAGAVVLVEGEHGIGKSRLLRELQLHVRALGPALVLAGRERFSGAQVPFGIFAEALRPAVRAPGIAGASAHLLAEAARLLPELRDSMQLPDVAAVEDESARLRFFEGVAAVIDAAAYEQPVLMVLDDVQHLPPSSFDLLSYLIARLAGAPVMFVLAVKPVDAPAAIVARLRTLCAAHDASDSVQVVRHACLELAPLATGDVSAAVSDAAEALGVPRSSVASIVRAAQGNPLRLMQAVRAASAGEGLNIAPVPLRDVLIERFQLLSSTQRRIFLVLALLGRPANARLLVSAAHVPDAAMNEALLLLEQYGWIERAGGTVSIANETAATIVCDEAGAASRAFIAAWIAEAVAADAAASDVELARLYGIAGRASDAFDHARRAGFQALANGASSEAVQLFSAARTFATTVEQQRDIESALAAAGSGKRRLSPGPARERPESTDDTLRSGQTVTARTPPRRSLATRVFPHWQILLTAATATALIASFALATRSSAVTNRDATSDTLVVIETEAGGRRAERLAIGSLAGGFSLTERLDRRPSGPTWVDSVSRPWSHTLVAPRGDKVALARADSVDAPLVVVSADRRDTSRLRTSPGVVPLAWSPDGTRILASAPRRALGGVFDSDLYILTIGGGAAIAVDTAADRAIAEAAWSPDGSHVAWVARTGTRGQLEVFVGLADGSDARNVSASVADDYHIAWSPSGDLLAFTSTRDGNPEIYVADLGEARLWRLTTNVAYDDNASFAPSGRFVAFESTRDGFGAVYVVPRLGGQPRPVDRRRALDISGWRASPPRYVDRVRIEAPVLGAAGATGTLIARAFDRRGDSMAVQDVDWRVLDSTVAVFADSSGDRVAVQRRLRAVAPGLARVVASVGRWRADTVVVRVGDQAVTLLDERFAADWQRRWRALGDPEPITIRAPRGARLLLRAPASWDSGILSLESLPLLPGLSVRADLAAPFARPSDAGMIVTLSLAAPETDADIDAATPQLLRLVSLSWNAESRRLIYSVGREAFSEPADALLPNDTLSAEIRVREDNTVSFAVFGQQRWRSGLRLSSAQFGSRAQLWISGRATGDDVRIAHVRAAIESATSR